MPPHERGLLTRLDALVTLVADRHGLALLGHGCLAAAEARAGRPGGRPGRLDPDRTGGRDRADVGVG